MPFIQLNLMKLLREECMRIPIKRQGCQRGYRKVGIQIESVCTL